MKVTRTEGSPPRTSLSWKWKQEIARWDSSWKNANSHIWAKLMHTTVGDGRRAGGRTAVPRVAARAQARGHQCSLSDS